MADGYRPGFSEATSQPTWGDYHGFSFVLPDMPVVDGMCPPATEEGVINRGSYQVTASGIDPTQHAPTTLNGSAIYAK